MLKIIFVALISLVIRSAWADAVNTDHIFSEDVYVGGITCGDLGFEPGAGGYCEPLVPIYSSNGELLKKNEKLRVTCVQGGGKCTAVMLVLDKKLLKSGLTVGKVKNSSDQNAWIKIDPAKLKKVEELLPSSETGYAAVDFRPTLKSVYLDKGLSKTVAVADIGKSKDGKGLDPRVSDVEFKETWTGNISGRKFIGLTVNLITLDQKKLKEGDALGARDSGKRTKLREIYFPAFDEKGRINYWYSPPGC